MVEEPRVDLRSATGVQVGTGNTQIIYQYDALTWTDGVSRPPLASVSGALESPYRGLGAYGERDAPYFFGREQLTTELLDRLGAAAKAARSRVVVSGVSGAGKSSLLRAGLIPRLRGAGLRGIPESARWPCLFFTPGSDPLAELSLQLAALAGLDAASVRRGAMADPAGLALTIRQATGSHTAALPELPETAGTTQPRMLLVIDQFEQVFTQVDPDRRRAFLEALEAAAAGPGTPAALLLLGIRADFEARCAEVPGFADAVQDRLLVTGMTLRQLREVVTGPASKAGVSVENALVDTLLDELAGRRTDSLAGAGALPLLSHALDQAWRHRTGPTLTLADYDRTGGIEGAVAASAQRCFDSLDLAQQQVTREIFTRLVAVGDDGADTARRVSRQELTVGPEDARASTVDAVLDSFASERLLTLAAGSVELSHEVILRSWPLLRDEWLARTRALRVVGARWSAAARQWDDHGRESSYLLRGQSLAEACGCADEIAIGTVPPMGQVENDFLTTSFRAERRRRFTRRGLIAALAVIALTLGVLAVVATRASRHARDERDLAIAGQLVDGSMLAQDSDPHRAAVMALAALRLHDVPDTQYAVADAAAQSSTAALHIAPDTVHAVAVSPDGSLLAADTDPGVTIWQAGDLARVAHLDTKDVQDLAFSPDSRSLAVASDTATELVDPRSGRVERTLDRSDEGVESIAFTSDGKVLFGLGFETFQAWNAGTGEELGRRALAAIDYRTVAVNPVDSTVVLAGDAGLLAFSQSGPPVPVRIPDVMDVAFAPDGRQLAVVTYEGRLRLLDTRTWRTLSPTVSVESGSLLAVTFADNGRLVAASGSSGIALWRSRDLILASRPLAGGDGPVASLAVTPDGRTLVAGTTLGVLHVWDLAVAAPEQAGAVTTTSPRTSSVATSPDGATLAVGHSGGTVEIVRTATGQRRQLLHTGMQEVTAVDFDPTGHLLTMAGGSHNLSGRTGAQLEQWSGRGSWHRVRQVPASGPRVASMDVSPDGKYIAAEGYDGSVEEWDGELSSSLWMHPSPSDSPVQNGQVAFNSSGGTLAVGDWQGHVQLLTPATGTVRASFRQPDGSVDSFSFAAHDRLLAVGSSDGRILMWDTHTATTVGEPITSGGVTTFAPDGRTLFTADSGGIHAWDAATHQQLGDPLLGDPSPVTSIVLTPDGDTLVTGYADGSVSRWDVSYLKNPVGRLCARPGATYTDADWRADVPRGPSPRTLCS